MVTLHFTFISFIFICFYWIRRYYNSTPSSNTSIHCVCSKDYRLIGQYNDFVYHSLVTWCYAIEVYFYRRGIEEDIHKLFIDWNEECNVDSDGILYGAIERSHTLFLNAVNAAKLRETEPYFGVPVDFNFNCYGNSLRWNDYVDMKTIIEYLNEIMEVYSSE